MGKPAREVAPVQNINVDLVPILWVNSESETGRGVCRSEPGPRFRYWEIAGAMHDESLDETVAQADLAWAGPQKDVAVGLAQVLLIFAAAWLLVAFLTRYSSLAALVAAVSVPVALLLFGQYELAGFFAGMSVIVFVTHRANISRLLAGTESRIGSKG